MKPTPDISCILKSITQAYEQTKSAIDGKLKPLGYQIIVEKYHPEAFGSRWVDWTNGKVSIRFIWDGKDRWFYLYSLKGVPQGWTDDWKVIIYVPFEPKEQDDSYTNKIPGKMVACLREEE